MAAVQAEPAALGVGDEELAGFHKLREVGEAAAVGLLDFGNLLEGGGGAPPVFRRANSAKNRPIFVDNPLNLWYSIRRGPSRRSRSA